MRAELVRYQSGLDLANIRLGQLCHEANDGLSSAVRYSAIVRQLLKACSYHAAPVAVHIL